MINCELCPKDKKFNFITPSHLKSKHSITTLEYRTRFPDAPIFSEELRLSKMGAGNGFYNKKHTKETKDLISESNKQYYSENETWNKNLDMKEYLGEDRFKEIYNSERKPLTEEHKKKISDSIKGENHPLYGKHHTAETRFKMSEKQKLKIGDKNPFYGKKHTKETKNLISKTKKAYYLEHPEAAIESSIRMKNNRHKMFCGRNTKPELKLKQILEENNIKYIQQFVIKSSKNKFYDFYLPEYNILIEVDGCYWHCKPSIYVNGHINETQKYVVINDIEKNKLAEDNGYRLIRVWEDEIDTCWRIIVP